MKSNEVGREKLKRQDRIRKDEYLAVREAYMVTFWPTPDYRERGGEEERERERERESTCRRLCASPAEGDLNFRVRSATQ